MTEPTMFSDSRGQVTVSLENGDAVVNWNGETSVVPRSGPRWATTFGEGPTWSREGVVVQHALLVTLYIGDMTQGPPMRTCVAVDEPQPLAPTLPTPSRGELQRVLSCVEVVLYGDECPDGPCEEDDCVTCNSGRRVDRHFRRGEFAVVDTIG